MKVACRTDSGRSALAAGTALRAPKPTLMITLTNGEVGWIVLKNACSIVI